MNRSKGARPVPGDLPRSRRRAFAVLRFIYQAFWVSARAQAHVFLLDEAGSVPLTRYARAHTLADRLVLARVPGARRLVRLLESPGGSGYEFLAERAWHYFRRGELSRIEHAVGQPTPLPQHRPRVDLRLKNGTRVETKSWRGWDWISEKNQGAMLDHLEEQVATYLGGRGKSLRVEFDAVVPGPAEMLLKRLQKKYGDRLWFGAI